MYIIHISIIEEGSCLGQLQLCNVPQSGFDSHPVFSRNHFQCFNPAQSNCCNLYSFSILTSSFTFFRFLIFLGVWVRKCIQFCTGWPPFITFLKSQKTSLSFPFPANNSDPLRHPPPLQMEEQILVSRLPLRTSIDQILSQVQIKIHATVFIDQNPEHSLHSRSKSCLA